MILVNNAGRTIFSLLDDTSEKHFALSAKLCDKLPEVFIFVCENITTTAQSELYFPDGNSFFHPNDNPPILGMLERGDISSIFVNIQQQNTISDRVGKIINAKLTLAPEKHKAALAVRYAAASNYTSTSLNSLPAWRGYPIYTALTDLMLRIIYPERDSDALSVNKIDAAKFTSEEKDCFEDMMSNNALIVAASLSLPISISFAWQCMLMHVQHGSRYPIKLVHQDYLVRRILHREPHGALECAITHNDLAVVRFLCEQCSAPITTAAMLYALECTKTDDHQVLEYLLDKYSVAPNKIMLLLQTVLCKFEGASENFDQHMQLLRNLFFDPIRTKQYLTNTDTYDQTCLYYAIDICHAGKISTAQALALLALLLKNGAVLHPTLHDGKHNLLYQSVHLGNTAFLALFICHIDASLLQTLLQDTSVMGLTPANLAQTHAASTRNQQDSDQALQLHSMLNFLVQKPLPEPEPEPGHKCRMG